MYSRLSDDDNVMKNQEMIQVSDSLGFLTTTTFIEGKNQHTSIWEIEMPQQYLTVELIFNPRIHWGKLKIQNEHVFSGHIVVGPRAIVMTQDELVVRISILRSKQKGMLFYYILTLEHNLEYPSAENQWLEIV